jgi:lipopolysaccharide export system protein LptA
MCQIRKVRHCEERFLRRSNPVFEHVNVKAWIASSQKALLAMTNSILLFVLSTLTAHALDTDRKEKLNIIADSGVYNFKTGVDIYEGHVQVNQGTTHITADKLITKKNDQHKIMEATAYGNETLAHFWTLQKPGEPEMHAHAKLIRFYPLEMNVSLEHEVHITQGDNSFKGELIHYNNNDQTITLPESANGHAMIVYNPEKKHA